MGSFSHALSALEAIAYVLQKSHLKMNCAFKVFKVILNWCRQKSKWGCRNVLQQRDISSETYEDIAALQENCNFVDFNGINGSLVPRATILTHPNF